MVKVDIISGFLGAGKTTLIKKLYEKAFKTEKVALIENEFGEIGIDGAFLKQTGVNLKEINSGCICCSLSGDFKSALLELIEKYAPKRIIIEPSGVGKLSEVITAVKQVDKVELNVIVTVVDANKAKMYAKNFKEFYIDQISNANTVIITKAENLSQEKIIEVSELIKSCNPTATIITKPVFELNGELLLENLEDGDKVMKFIIDKLKHQEHHEHEHHEHEHGCCEHDSDCCCHHDAGEAFDSFSIKTDITYSQERLHFILRTLGHVAIYGDILRAKGVVKGDDGNWYEFNYVPGVYEINKSEPSDVNKISVIGTTLDKARLEVVFSI